MTQEGIKESKGYGPSSEMSKDQVRGKKRQEKPRVGGEA